MYKTDKQKSKSHVTNTQTFISVVYRICIKQELVKHVIKFSFLMYIILKINIEFFCKHNFKIISKNFKQFFFLQENVKKNNVGWKRDVCKPFQLIKPHLS